MSIATQITALTNDRDSIRSALVAQGISAASSHGFDSFAEDIAAIQGGIDWETAIIHVYGTTGSIVTATKGSVTKTASEHNGEWFFYIAKADRGSWIITREYGQDIVTKTVAVASNVEYLVSFDKYYLYNNGLWTGENSLLSKAMKHDSGASVSGGIPVITYGPSSLTIKGSANSSYYSGSAYFKEKFDLTHSPYTNLHFKGSFKSRTGTSAANVVFAIWRPDLGTYLEDNMLDYSNVSVGGTATEKVFSISDLPVKQDLVFGVWLSGNNASSSSSVTLTEVYFE